MRFIRSQRPVVLLCAALALVMAGVGWFASRSNSMVAGRPMNDWLDDLRAKPDEVRAQAHRTLRAHPVQSVPLLILVLDRQPNRARQWIETRMGTAMPHRLRMRDHDTDRRNAAAVLGRMGESARPAVPALLRVADSANWTLAEEASNALLRLGDIAAPRLATTIVERPEDPLARRAALILGRMHPHNLSAMPVLVPAFEILPLEMQTQLAPVLGRAAAAHPPAAAVLERVVVHGATRDVRIAALKALGLEAGPGSPTDTFERQLVSEDRALRFHAATGLWRATGNAGRSLPAIREGLDDDHLRITAVTLLGEMGASAVGAVPDLVRVLAFEQSHRPLRTPPAAGIALSRIGAATVPAVTALLTHTNAQSRLNAVITLGLLGRRAHGAGAAVLAMLDDSSAEVRFSAALSLNSMGVHSTNAVPVLREMLADDDPFLVTWAADAMEKIEPAGGPVAPPR